MSRWDVTFDENELAQIEEFMKHDCKEKYDPLNLDSPTISLWGGARSMKCVYTLIGHMVTFKCVCGHECLIDSNW